MDTKCHPYELVPLSQTLFLSCVDFEARLSDKQIQVHDIFASEYFSKDSKEA